MTDVLVVGAGPSGAIAAIALARAGARVCLVDRSTFPREKLCGDTVNPGTLAALRRLGLAHAVDAIGGRIDGMIVTGERGASIVGRYPSGLTGRAISRVDLDWALVQCAIDEGVEFVPRTAVRRAIVRERRGAPGVAGVIAARGGRACEWRAPVTIAADGRRSTLAFGLGLARASARPRRWAIGMYFDNVRVPGGGTFGEMHVRRGRYLGVAPLPDGRVNVCLVKATSAADPEFRCPELAVAVALAQDPLLADRFSAARPLGRATVLGPLAVEETGHAVDGVLVAGDAAGFVDPMTGDGLRFAVRGGELAAAAALDALEHGWRGVHARLRDARARDFRSKQRFNRALRALVGSPAAVRGASAAAPFARWAVEAIVARAGDCGIARTDDFGAARGGNSGVTRAGERGLARAADE
jgi:flavin-dependent dehydrogenase